MATSTWTEASIWMVVMLLTTSIGLWVNRSRKRYATRSITLLWILISRCSQVLVPSPQGDLRVVIRRNLVGIRTGPATLTFLLRAIRLISAQTRKSATTRNAESTLLHGLDVGGSQSNTDAVHLLVDNFILLHDVVYLVNGREERSDSKGANYADTK